MTNRISKGVPGGGRFTFSARSDPGDMAIEWTGVESDPSSASIAAALHPGATIINRPLERTSLRPGSVDAAIGNIPFSTVAPHDPEMYAGSLHEDFLGRAVEAVRSGGYVVAITSRHTVDSATAMDAVTDDDHLVAAVRLRSGAFAADGTEVVADVVILRKHDDTPVPSAWNDYRECTPEGGDAGYRSGYPSYCSRPVDRRHVIFQDGSKSTWGSVAVNRYWQVHSTRVAGTTIATGFDRAPLCVKAEDVRAQTLAALADTHRDLVPFGTAQPEVSAPFADLDLVDDEGRKEGSSHLTDSGKPEPLERVDETSEARAERSAPLFAAETDFTELVGPIRRMYSSGQAVTVPASLELIYVLDGTDPDAVTYRVQLAYEGAWAEYGSSTARQYYESASWDLTVTFVEGAPLVTAASWAT